MLKEDIVKRLNKENVSTFFTKLSRMDVIVYSEAFCLEDVYKLAYKRGWLITYCGAGTEEYKKYGCMTCRALWKV